MGVDPGAAATKVNGLAAERVQGEGRDRQIKLGTFGGVFVPTLLTVLGTIMFLREGWVVGNAGLIGAWLIILLAYVITASTGLAMSSIVTNIRMGAGGPYSLIAHSLGLEVAGSISLPLALSQALAVCLYIFGFREGWQWIFPNHPALLIDLLVFSSILTVTFISTTLAIRVQYLILAVIIGALASIAAAAATGSMDQSITWWGDFPGSPESGFSGTSFWVVFAVFFPAATGIMAGANMSGDLKDARRSIPIGTMSAIVLSLLVYLSLAYWLARSAAPDELAGNFTIAIDRAYWSPAVVAGLLGATYSSALVSFMGAPRILQALGEHKVLPAGAWLSKRTRGEPLRAVIVCAMVVGAGLALRDINAVAPLITVFFLITYATVNLVVLVEQSIELASFRPTLEIPRFVPAVGLVGCVVVMLIINPVLSAAAGGVIIVTYIVLLQRQITAPFPDVRSGILIAVAEWAAKKARMMQANAERSWKPHLLVPTDDARKVEGLYRIVYDIAHPSGSVKLLGIASSKRATKKLRADLQPEKRPFRSEGIFATASAIEADSFGQGILRGAEVLADGLFPPNVLFVTVPADEALQQELQTVLAEIKSLGLGVVVMVGHPSSGFGLKKAINLWVADQGPDWKMKADFRNLDLSVLLSYRLIDRWDATLNLIAAVDDPAESDVAQHFLEELKEAARLPSSTSVNVLSHGFGEYSSLATEADLNIFPLIDENLSYMVAVRNEVDTSCLFVRDGGKESALA